MKNLIKMAVVAVGFVGSSAFAADFSCPVGTKIMTLQNDVDLMVSSCVKGNVAQGPMRMFFKSTGKVHAEGLVDNGMRTGHWMFFDKAGVKTAEIDFKNGDYHGMRIEFHSNGAKSMEERWDNGLLEVAALHFDPAGNVITKTALLTK